jgi:hypothetical protein
MYKKITISLPQKEAFLMNRIGNTDSKCKLSTYRPRTGNPLVEGLRLSGLNLTYIVVSMSLFFTFIYWIPQLVHPPLYPHQSWYSIFMGICMLLALFVLLFAAIFYFYFWGWFTHQFVLQLERNHKRKLFLLGLLGPLPNFALWLGFPYWVTLLPGTSDDSCGGIFFFAGAYLIFALTSLVMPFSTWLHMINSKPKSREQ